MLRTVRIAAWVLVAIVIVVGAILWLRSSESDPRYTQTTEMVPIGGPFELTASDGRRFSSATLTGRPYAVFFGFTHCPDVCPTTLARLVKLRKQLGKSDQSFEIVLISVDPERDTPSELASYVGLFGAPVTALTGSVADIDRVKRLFGAYSAKAPGKDGNYGVDHTATVFLMDRWGKFRATIAPDEGDAAALDKLRGLTA